ncbi:toxin-antitoxin system TumE family protein [Pigmentiphaga soli]|uniref:toxin-antitoxin system TumE family protein n=1 Tax=Pigmentiphaga soli TaxID=1007095 RepID=UPI003CD0ADB1
MAQPAKLSSSAGSGHKYRLAYVVNEVCVLRYDNEVGKDGHRHVDGEEVSHTFTTPAQLIADFWRDVNQRRNLQ